MNTTLNYRESREQLDDFWQGDGKRDERESVTGERKLAFHLSDALNTLKDIARHLQFAYGDMSSAEKSIAEILHVAGIVDINEEDGEVRVVK